MKKIEWGDFIHSDPSVLLGKPVVREQGYLLSLFSDCMRKVGQKIKSSKIIPT
jgi:hypothetical protein